MFSAEHAFKRMKTEGLIYDAATECYNYEAAWNENRLSKTKLKWYNLREVFI